ncbi:MAG: DUF2142 domain-containing protein, partial [Enterococcus sp.]|nr:DUF2142 domain-containing protein [Enterococcus sp.]
ISLIATMVFLAANFAYDPFLYAMLLLGLSMTLKLRYSKDKSIQTSQVLAILLVFTIGFSPKAIYVLLLGVMFIVPKSKFVSKANYAKYIGSIFGFGFFTLITFVLPFFITGGSNVSDVRGGADVNAVGQLAFILGSPFSYLSILGDSLIGWLNVNTLSTNMTNFAYLAKLEGITAFVALPLIFTAITDVNKFSVKLITPFNVIFCLIIVVSLTVLIPTAMYVSFNPVGNTIIKGFQERYLYILLPTFLGLCLNFKLQNDISKIMYNRCLLGFYQFVALGTTFALLTCKLTIA